MLFKTMEPLLSIIVPVYNVEPYLSKCITSIQNQTLQKFELLITDDGSQNSCSELCDFFAMNDDRIIIIHQKNRGVSVARNKGLEFIRGQYVGFVDSDDWIDPEMYKEMLIASENGKYDLVVCGCKYYTCDYKFSRKSLSSIGEYNREELLELLYGKPNPLGGTLWNKILSRRIISDVRFREELRLAEDWVYLFEVIKNCSSCKKLSSSYYNVYERENSVTRGNGVKGYYDLICGGKLYSILLACSYSLNLEKVATDKYIDDCIRYSNIIRDVGKRNSSPWRWYFFKIRIKAIAILPRAIRRKLLSKDKIHGFVYELIH